MLSQQQASKIAEQDLVIAELGKKAAAFEQANLLTQKLYKQMKDELV